MKKGLPVNMLLGMTIAFLPFYNRVTRFDFNRTSKDNLLVVIFGVIGFLLPNANRKMNFYLYFALFAGLFLLILNQHEVLSIVVMMQIFYISSGMLFFANYFEKHDKNSINYLYKGMIFGSLAQSILIIFGFFGFDIHHYLLNIFSSYDLFLNPVGRDNVIGSFGNSNLAASYLCLSLFSFLSLDKYKILIIFPIISLVMTKSWMGLFSACAGLFYYLNVENIKKWKFYFISSFAMVLFYFTGLNGKDSGRFEIWKKIFALVDGKHLFFGKGAGWFADQKIMYKGEYVIQEHNSFISFFNIFGILGFIVIAPIFIKFLKTKDKNKIFASILFAAFCNSYGHFTMHQSTTVVIILIASCICMTGDDEHGSSLERERTAN